MVVDKPFAPPVSAALGKTVIEDEQLKSRTFHARFRMALAALVLLASALPSTTMAEAGRISGTAADASTGAPLAGAEVTVTELGQTFLADGQGHFVIKVPAGSYSLRIAAPTFKDS